jgi:hypothetical protein
MRFFLPAASAAALLFISSALSAQTDSPAAQAAPVTQVEHQPQIKYFSLEHRGPEAMDSADSELLRSRQKELVSEAQLYGYDITTGNWKYDQAICPQLPDTLLVHYLNKFPDGSESLFTALIPRKGRTRIVPVLYRNASPYTPAVTNPRNFALFNALVPAEIAKKDSGPEGKWLSLGVCYAEVVGGRPNVPDEPSLDTATIKAPVATYRFDTATQQRQVQFSDRDAAKVYTIWTISFNQNGRVTGAVNEDYATYVAHIVQPAEPTGKIIPATPPSKVTPIPPDPPVKISNPPSQN